MITLVLGGARSGKSELAERLIQAAEAESGGGVTYLATMQLPGLSAGPDSSIADRIAAHRARRPARWRTVEVGADLPDVLDATTGPVLLDSLGPWLAGHQDFVVDVSSLCAALARRQGDTVIVSDEVGLGVVPATALGGTFRDALGALNRAVAEVADRAFLVVAGRVLTLDRPPVA